MLQDHIPRFYVLLTLGLATIAFAFLHLLLGRFTLRTRVIAGLMTYASALAVVGSVIAEPFVLISAASLVLLAVTVGIEGRFRLLSLLSRPFTSSRRASLSFATLGVVLTAGSLLLYSFEEDAYFARLDDDLGLQQSVGQLSPTPFSASTDRGRPVSMKIPAERRSRERLEQFSDRTLQDQKLVNRVIKYEPSDDASNCHGWVFTGGKYWVGGGDVDSILSDNGYAPVEHPRPGDLVVYRRNGEVAHTAIVRYVTEGRPILVEGKWGTFGVFLHDVDQSCYRFAHAYYTTSRPTHLLREFATPSDLLAIDAAAVGEPVMTDD
jgi:hypothetical protein